MDADMAKRFKQVMDDLQAEQKSDVLLYNGPIDHAGFTQLLQMTTQRTNQTVLLLLTTPGGDAGYAFRIARALVKRYSRFRLLVCGPCKSAGTLIAIGAHEIVMTDNGELGPLDVQIRKHDELMQRESGLDIIEALDHLTHATIDAFRDTLLEVTTGSGLSTKLCAEIASNLVTQLYGNIYSQVDPIRLGSVVRANNIATDYGQRLGSKSLKPDALGRLVTGYPTHDFVIDREQAEELFMNVKCPTKGEDALVQLVESALQHPRFGEHVIFRLEPISIGAPNAETQQASASAPVNSDSNPAGSGTPQARGSGPHEQATAGSDGHSPPAVLGALMRGALQ